MRFQAFIVPLIYAIDIAVIVGLVVSPILQARRRRRCAASIKGRSSLNFIDTDSSFLSKLSANKIGLAQTLWTQFESHLHLPAGTLRPDDKINNLTGCSGFCLRAIEDSLFDVANEFISEHVRASPPPHSATTIGELEISLVHAAGDAES